MIATDTVEAGNIAAGAIGTSELATNAVEADDIKADAVETAKIKDGAVTAAKLAATLDLSAKTLTLPAALTPVFTKSFKSTDQTISNAGTLTLAHGLGVMPELVQIRGKCTSAELGYSVDDEVILNPSVMAVGGGEGVAVVPDATNVVVKFANTANPIGLKRKDTGASAAATSASWKLIVRAWA